MQAAVFHRYGGPEVVQVETLPDPTPAAGEILIHNRATTVNSGDARIRGLRVPAGFGLMVRLFFGVFRPRKKVLGFSLAGEVAATGADVSAFRPGDRVVASMPSATGAHAEQVVLGDEAAIAFIPDEVSDQDAAAVIFGGHTALYFLDTLAAVKPGDHVAINGASGSVGTAMIEIATLRGATVTAICSGPNEALVRGLGADHVVDYTTTTLAETGERYDIIADCVGNLSWDEARPLLTDQGCHLMVVSGLWAMIKAGFVSKKDGKRCLSGTANTTSEDLRVLMDLLAQGEISAVVDSTLPLSAIAQAHARVDSERKTGAVVIAMA